MFRSYTLGWKVLPHPDMPPYATLSKDGTYVRVDREEVAAVAAGTQHDNDGSVVFITFEHPSRPSLTLRWLAETGEPWGSMPINGEEHFLPWSFRAFQDKVRKVEAGG
jgi:hypothetical protein